MSGASQPARKSSTSRQFTRQPTEHIPANPCRTSRSYVKCHKKVGLACMKRHIMLVYIFMLRPFFVPVHRDRPLDQQLSAAAVCLQARPKPDSPTILNLHLRICCLPLHSRLPFTGTSFTEDRNNDNVLLDGTMSVVASRESHEWLWCMWIVELKWTYCIWMKFWRLGSTQKQA